VQTTRPPQVSNYALWIETELTRYYPDAKYFNLDILSLEIGKVPSGSKEYYELSNRSAEATYKNQLWMEREGVHPLPVWHAGEPECLTGNTKIISTKGKSKSIKDIKVGDKLIGWRISDKRLVETTVVGTKKKNVDTILKITFENGEYLEVTPEHPLYVCGKGWIEAKYICSGNDILKIEWEEKNKLVNHNKISSFVHNGLKVSNVEQMKGNYDVFNIQCEPHPNYFSSLLSDKWKQNLFPAVLSHNCYLQHYCQNYDYVAIGGLVGGGLTKENIARLIIYLKHDYPNTKFHFFGIGLLGIGAFKAVRPYSVDFSTWSVPARFGHDLVYDKNQFLKEIKLNDEIRANLKTDKNLQLEYLRKAVRSIKKLEEEIETYHSDYQTLLM